MFEIRLEDMNSPRRLTQSVIQIMQLLGLYQAELARILHVNCADVTDLGNGRNLLQPGTQGWRQAELLVCLFERLHRAMRGDAVAMRHWLGAEHKSLRAAPLLAMVDGLRIGEVIELLEPVERTLE